MNSLVALIALSGLFFGTRGPDPDYRAAEAEATTASATASQADSLIFRRILKVYDYMFYGRPPSPDGRYVPDVDWRTGDLAVFDLQSSGPSIWTGLRKVTDKGPWAENFAYAESSVFSPDGTRIAYAWFGTGEDTEGYGLRVIGTDGSGMRILVPAAEDHHDVQVFDWSVDGEHVLISLRDPYGTSLSSVSIGDGSIRVLRRLSTSGEGSLGRAYFSPDGRHVAYDYIASEGSFDTDIRVLAVDGSREAAVVAGNGNDRLMGWTRDGSGILFHSNRALKHAVWLQALEGGEPEGEPRLIKSDVWQLRPFGFAGDRYYYGVVTAWPQVQTAVLDLAGGRVVSPPAPIEEPSQARSSFGVWSPDGRQVAFLKSHGLSGKTHGRLAIRTLETGEIRLIPFPVADVRRLWWGPDTHTMTVFGSYRRRDGIHRLDMQTGEIRTLFETNQRDRWQLAAGAFSPDGRVLYAVEPAGGEGPLTVVVHDFTTGQKHQLARASGQAARVAVSPDGAMLAIYEQDGGAGGSSRIRVLSTSNGEERTVYSLSGPEDASAEAPHGLMGAPSAFVWTPDAFRPYSGSTSARKRTSVASASIPTAAESPSAGGKSRARSG
jgi:Tol biopolymer transport system component